MKGGAWERNREKMQDMTGGGGEVREECGGDLPHPTY
jgi:hypothetical protein